MFDSHFMKFVFQISGVIKIRDPFDGSDSGGSSSISVRWNTYLLFNSCFVNFVWKTNEVEVKSIVLFFGGALIIDGWGVVGWGRKSYFRDFGRSNKHGTLWHSDNLFLWGITLPDFCHLEIYKNLGLPLSTISFTVNSHADNHFYKYVYFFQILYSMKQFFN